MPPIGTKPSSSIPRVPAAALAGCENTAGAAAMSPIARRRVILVCTSMLRLACFAGFDVEAAMLV
jgi:hypothetical protein